MISLRNAFTVACVSRMWFHGVLADLDPPPQIWTPGPDPVADMDSPALNR